MRTRHVRTLHRSVQRRQFGDVSGFNSRVSTVLGAQWGDEGKGKLVDVLAGSFDIVARFNGGANAGHTLVVGEGAEKLKFAFHMLPCGLLQPDAINVIGNGVVVDLPQMFDELKDLDAANIDYKGRLLISDRAHILFQFYKTIDGMQEDGRAGDMIGTTRKGIGPCYSAKTARTGIRMAELFEPDFKDKYRALLNNLQKQFGFEHDGDAELAELDGYKDVLNGMTLDTAFYVNNAYNQGKSILSEGANAALLDIDFGTYPMVTSSSVVLGGVCTGLGLAPNKLGTTVGVVKAYTTRVGKGPFPTELENDIGDHLQKVGFEFGATTGRRRRCGWLDIPVVQYSNMLSGYSSVNITKLDVLNDLDEICIGTTYSINGQDLKPGEMPSTMDELAKVKVKYETHPGWNSDIGAARKVEDLPDNARKYLTRIEQLMGVPVSWVGVGPGRTEMATQGFTVPA